MKVSKLPLGTLVKLNSKASGSLLIIGYDPETTNNSHNDYAGVLYPQGYGQGCVFGFNHEDIVEILR